LAAENVDEHIKRMRLVRQYPPEMIAGKEMLGAMAGVVVDPEVKDYAHSSGFFVLELAGESVRLFPPPPFVSWQPHRYYGITVPCFSRRIGGILAG
jgi:hypothetical protein